MKMLTKPDRPMIVAELSCNHDHGQYAEQLIAAAKRAGCDAVKIQLYQADDMIIGDPPKPMAIKDDPWFGYSLKNLYTRAGTSKETAEKMFSLADRIGIPIFSSIFSSKDIEFLERMKVPAYKIASFEANDYELIKDVAKTNKPLYISINQSTGDASILHLLNVLNGYHHNLTLMHCVSAYPTAHSDLNMGRIHHIRNALNFAKIYEVDIGFSDHTITDYGGMVAAAMKCTVIEKHLDISCSKSFDKDHSVDEMGMKFYIENIHAVARTLNPTRVDPEKHFRFYKRSLHAIKDVKKGDIITSDCVGAFRPYTGLDPIYRDDVVGGKALVDIKYGSPIKQDMVKWKT